MPFAATNAVATITLLSLTILTYKVPVAFVPVPSTLVLLNPFTSLKTLPVTLAFVKGIFAEPATNDSKPALSFTTKGIFTVTTPSIGSTNNGTSGLPAALVGMPVG